MDSRRKGVGRALITELLDRAERYPSKATHAWLTCGYVLAAVGSQVFDVFLHAGERAMWLCWRYVSAMQQQ